MIKQLKKFKKIIKEEKKIANKIALKYHIDVVISDNRYGFHGSSTKNIFICHQTKIKTSKIVQPFINYINQRLIDKFDYCWIPDVDDKSNFSGSLSETNSAKSLKIGILSRFKNKIQLKPKYKYKFIAIISGPEPQRTIVEKKIISEFSKLNDRCAIINGKIKNDFKDKNSFNNIDRFSHQGKEAFIELISDSETLICRSGYSSVMDLSILQKQAILIPTPGQTEQEYLAKYHYQKSKIGYLNQSEFSLTNAHLLKGKIAISKSNCKLLDIALQKLSL